MMRLSIENLNALEIGLWLCCVLFLKCSEQTRSWINQTQWMREMMGFLVKGCVNLSYSCTVQAVHFKFLF